VVINGLVDSARTLSMRDILRLPTVEVTCTLTCAGNRRKEQNMVKKTIGFNWGPSGTSCSTWTGVRMSVLLQACGVQGPEQGAAYVCMRGPKGELPKGDDGSYGTSITLHRAMDPAYDVILAYKQNGRLLTPDHGFPLRVIIPGLIGGRMIKWLEEITVTAQESQNYYHFFDNRILPSHVDQEMATKEGECWAAPALLDFAPHVVLLR
jgi:nitrate reductase (NAD(P)H)